MRCQRIVAVRQVCWWGVKYPELSRVRHMDHFMAHFVSMEKQHTVFKNYIWSFLSHGCTQGIIQVIGHYLWKNQWFGVAIFLETSIYWRQMPLMFIHNKIQRSRNSSQKITPLNIPRMDGHGSKPSCPTRNSWYSWICIYCGDNTFWPIMTHPRLGNSMGNSGFVPRHAQDIALHCTLSCWIGEWDDCYSCGLLGALLCGARNLRGTIFLNLQGLYINFGGLIIGTIYKPSRVGLIYKLARSNMYII